ncbi:MAG: outer membrane lipoprotein-sorting protein, partial [Gammaproteobacteria bacterium]|nr:outer membrane lipoprotein-sorting protein [Gammaproteobacteria bacterium]
QQNVLVKKLVTSGIKPMGGKLVATRERMQRADKPGEWTEVVTKEVRFGVPMAAGTFTLSNLRNPRE